MKNAEGTAGVVLTNVDNGLEIVGEKVADMQADNAQRAADREAAQEARDKAAEETNRTAANLKEAVFIKAEPRRRRKLATRRNTNMKHVDPTSSSLDTEAHKSIERQA